MKSKKLFAVALNSTTVLALSLAAARGEEGHHIDDHNHAPAAIVEGAWL